MTPKFRHSSERSCASHKVYGLDCDRYNELLDRANHQCQLCADDYSLVIDHDHSLGAWAVRGILCGQCNAHLHHKAGPEVDRYLANPWHRAHPDHPLTPTPRSPTPRAVELYMTLDSIRAEFDMAITAAQRREARYQAERIGLLLLAEREGSKAIVKRAPFSDSHFRKAARAAGLAPARNGTLIRIAA